MTSARRLPRTARLGATVAAAATAALGVPAFASWSAAGAVLPTPVVESWCTPDAPSPSSSTSTTSTTSAPPAPQGAPAVAAVVTETTSTTSTSTPPDAPVEDVLEGAAVITFAADHPVSGATGTVTVCVRNNGVDTLHDQQIDIDVPDTVTGVDPSWTIDGINGSEVLKKSFQATFKGAGEEALTVTPPDGTPVNYEWDLPARPRTLAFVLGATVQTSDVMGVAVRVINADHASAQGVPVALTVLGRRLTAAAAADGYARFSVPVGQLRPGTRISLSAATAQRLGAAGTYAAATKSATAVVMSEDGQFRIVPGSHRHGRNSTIALQLLDPSARGYVGRGREANASGRGAVTNGVATLTITDSRRRVVLRKTVRFGNAGNGVGEVKVTWKPSGRGTYHATLSDAAGSWYDAATVTTSVRVS